jgi:hypothetical protein
MRPQSSPTDAWKLPQTKGRPLPGHGPDKRGPLIAALTGLVLVGAVVLVMKLRQRSDDAPDRGADILVRQPSDDDERVRPKAPPDEKQPDPMKKPDPKPDDAPKIGRKIPPPRTERIPVGSNQLPERLPSVFVSRPRVPADSPFKRLSTGADVHSTDTLVTLPGYSSRIETRTGVAVTMRGNLPEFSVSPLMDSLLEVEVVLHSPPRDIDADLTLDRGRVYLTNLKDNKNAVVRLRFLDQAWDLTLQDGAEVGVDLIKKYPGDVNYLREQPWTGVALFVLQGKVELMCNGVLKRQLQAPPGLALVQWDSHTEDAPSAAPVPEAPLIWSRQPPFVVLRKHVDMLNILKEKSKPEDAQRLKFEIDLYTGQQTRTKDALGFLNEIGDALSGKRPLGVVLDEERHRLEPGRRHVALFALAGLGEVKTLLDALADEDPEHGVERDEAVFVLRRFVSRGLEPSRLLYQDDGKNKSGLLVEKYGARDAEKVFILLHDFDPKNLTPDTFRLLTFYLKSDKVPVRLLAFWHLSRLSIGVKLSPPAAMYNPVDLVKQRRDDAAAAWQKLVEDKKLPPQRP